MAQATQEHLAVFEAEARKWINRFGLYGWNIHYCIDEISSEARVYWNFSAKAAKFVLTSELQCEDAEYLRRLAIHEVIELLLAPIINPLLEFHSESFVDDRAHDVIRRLENAFFNTELAAPCLP